jgi:hypothetical protein
MNEQTTRKAKEYIVVQVQVAGERRQVNFLWRTIHRAGGQFTARFSSN